MNRVYLDHAATSPLVDKAKEEMLHVMETVHGNPSSPHLEGRAASRLLSKYRSDIASWLGAQPSQVVFTSGATEANNMAIGSCSGARLITSRAEHKAILEPAAVRGNAILVDPDEWGAVHQESVEAHWEEEALVSLMWVNNETGAVTDVVGIAEWVKSKGGYFHTDAVQALLWKPIRFDDSPFDMMSLSAHKIGGPKGIGILLRKNSAQPKTLSLGGGQEAGWRPGTENLIGVAGFWGALAMIADSEGRELRLRTVADAFADHLSAELGSDVRINRHASPQNVAPHIRSVTFFNNGAPLNSDLLLHSFDQAGIACSTGSACTSGAIEPSHVLSAMGLSREEAAATLRFSFSPNSTKGEAEEAAKRLSMWFLGYPSAPI